MTPYTRTRLDPVYLGIAHTRWATHGVPSEENAHPHSCCDGKIWIVHNGIIENYKNLKKDLEEKGHKFKSETDSEVVAYLIEENYRGDIYRALLDSLDKIEGAYGLAVFHVDYPNRLLAARKGSPLILGIGEDEYVIASDLSAILSYTKNVIFLEDDDVLDINKGTHKIVNRKLGSINEKTENIDWDLSMAEKGGYAHFTQKEIFEQPEALNNSIRGRIDLKNAQVKLGGLDRNDRLKNIDRLIIVACGTAYYAGAVARYMIEEYSGLNVSLEYASEFRYRKTNIDKNTAILAISQSGETADTIAALNEAINRGAFSLGIVNTVGSSISRLTDAGIYNHVGPEIGVASTKAFTSQLTILSLVTVLLGRQREMSFSTGKSILKELSSLSEKQEEVLNQKNIKQIAEKYFKINNIIYLGRKYNEPIAMEGALKMRELAYVNTLGLPSGELKHGSIALIDDEHLSIVIAPKDSVYEKNKSSIEEIKARKGSVIAITTEGNKELEDLADDVIYIPDTLELLTPILSVIPLQLLAYHFAVLRELDVDQPRNLAKSVTVE
ncbi:MAG: glutamine--fructose-6-phosphate transaminase (isomerizing) [Patescibacteria group bacterium]|nr:glutamine--fructose-6-phosphate transaminase (isomerizing) [Patescibacteria group bacterium]